MGRTNPTYRNVLARQEERWQRYRRGLRRGHQPHFDRLFERADRYADAAGFMNAEDPDLVSLFSMLLAQEAELQELRGELDALRDRLDESNGSDESDG